MTASRPAAGDPLTAGHVTTSTTEAHSRMHGRVLDVWENVLAHGAARDNSTDDSTAIAAAITAAGIGGSVYFPAGAYAYATTLVPLKHQTWYFAGGQRYSDSPTVGGVVLKYTGTATAIDLTGVEGVTFMPFKLSCTSDTSGVIGVKIGDPSNDHLFVRPVIKGPSTSNGKAVVFSGQSGCACHNIFLGATVDSWSKGWVFSGFGNANIIEGGVTQSCATGLDAAAIAPDTLAGADNAFIRHEFGGSITTAIHLATAAARYRFIGGACDGPTTHATIDSGATDALFIGMALDSTKLTDAGTRTAFSWIPGTSGGLLTGGIIAKSLGIGAAPSGNQRLRVSDSTQTNVRLTLDGSGIQVDLMADATSGFAPRIQTASKPMTLINSGGNNMFQVAAASLSSTATLSWGTGTPEAAVAATVGSLFLRTDGGANTTLYIKESGSGNTGWVAK